MIKRAFAIALSAAFLASTLAPTIAVAAAAKKELTPQQQKMKDCGAEWQTMKKDGRAKATSWKVFRKECLTKKA